MSIRKWLALPVAFLCLSTFVYADPIKPTPQALAVAQANNTFFVDLYRKIRKDEQNFCFSPYSISTSLAMISRGAAGETAAEITAVRGFKDPASDTDVGYLTLTAELESASADSDKKATSDPHIDLKIANSIWVQQDHPLIPAYVEKMREIHHAQLEPLDFADAAKAADAINQWVQAQTDGQIKDLIAPESLSAKSRIVLANALYFKAEWLHPFAVANTKPTDFTTASGVVVKTPMMFTTEDLDYASDDKCQAVELPYLGERKAMLILLPAQSAKTAEFEEALSASYIEKIRSSLQSRFVHVGLPQWKGTQSFDLVKPLRDLGMKLAFNSHADFSSMSATKGLRISSVAHAATIQVDEVGTTATAGTAVALPLAEDETPPIELKLDHPFIYLILDKTTGVILLGGRVMDPTKTN